MVQVLRPQGKGPSFLESLGAGIGSVLPGAVEKHFEGKKQQQLAAQQNEAMKKAGFGDLIGFPEKARDAAIAAKLKGEKPESALDAAKRKKIEQEISQTEQENKPFEESRSEFDIENPSSWDIKVLDKLRSYAGTNPQKKTLAKQAENEFEKREKQKKTEQKNAPFQGALQTINRMKQLGKTGLLGVGSSFNPLPSRQKASSEYEQLGKSLISLATTIPIRNQMEFEVLSKNLYDATLSDAKREGILNAMERIIKNSMEDLESDFQKPKSNIEVTQPMQSVKEKRPLTSFIK